MFIWGNDTAAVISDRYIALDCDCYQNYTIRDVIYDIHYLMDGDGTVLYEENVEILEILEHLFESNHNKQITE